MKNLILIILIGISSSCSTSNVDENLKKEKEYIVQTNVKADEAYSKANIWFAKNWAAPLPLVKIFYKISTGRSALSNFSITSS